MNMLDNNLNLADDLKQLLLREKFSLPKISDDEVELYEEDDKTKEKIMTVNLNGLPDNAVVIKCPKNQGGYFNSQWTKICDYIILAPNNEHLDVCFCELKNNTGREAYAATQIKHTKPLLHYILAGLKTHFNYKMSIYDTLQEHSIILINPKVAKKQLPNKTISNTGEDSKIFVRQFLSFSKIIAP